MERKQIPRSVTDASVAVKWFIEEKDTPRAVRLKELYENGQIELEAPSLLGYEVAFALRFHPKIRITLKQFLGVTEVLDQMQITREPNDIEWATAFHLSLENPVSVYDAVCLSFALSGTSKMLTADTSLITKLKTTEAKRNVIMLTDLGL